MTTLSSAVSIGDNALHINAPMTDEFPGYVKIGTELLSVGGQEYRSGTILTLSEPAAAAHNSGSTVTYAGRPFDPTFVAATGGGGAAEAGTVVSDTDPGAIGAGNIWVREYDDTGGTTGQMLYQVNVRNATDDGWLVPQLVTIIDGVLRTRVAPDPTANGGDIEIRDASGNTVFIAGFGPTGNLEIQSNAADFSWLNRLTLQAANLFFEREDAGVITSLYMDPLEVSLNTAAGKNIKMLGLPTADPVVAGALWNDTGTVKVSAG